MPNARKSDWIYRTRVVAANFMDAFYDLMRVQHEGVTSGYIIPTGTGFSAGDLSQEDFIDGNSDVNLADLVDAFSTLSMVAYSVPDDQAGKISRVRV